MIVIYKVDCANHDTRCSFLHRNTLSWRVAFGLALSDLDPKLKLRGKKWLLRKQKSVRTRSVHA